MFDHFGHFCTCFSNYWIVISFNESSFFINSLYVNGGIRKFFWWGIYCCFVPHFGKMYLFLQRFVFVSALFKLTIFWVLYVFLQRLKVTVKESSKTKGPVSQKRTWFVFKVWPSLASMPSLKFIWVFCVRKWSSRLVELTIQRFTVLAVVLAWINWRSFPLKKIRQLVFLQKVPSDFFSTNFDHLKLVFNGLVLRLHSTHRQV